ncbi:hypothetical protein Scep_030846 [Stephania cephalantha]|uniref:EF-hand domain-containing protein n=1 Tax=Stephania cephalantha TaxID=152367 RepID=A0AAP0HIZ4_9MAGN
MCPSGRDRLAGIRTSDGMSTGIKQAFDVIDADRDGKISAEDLRAFYSGASPVNAIAATTTEDDIGSMISVADSNRNGFVELDEFEQVLMKCRTTTSDHNEMAMMEDAFKVMDRDGDGLVGLEDLRSYMEWAGFELGDEEIKAMIRLGGGDESRGVCYQGLLKILAVGF